MSNVGTRRSLPIRNDFFDGGSNITGEDGALEDLINQLDEENTSITYDTTHIYVDENGDDSNDGSTLALAKATILAAIDTLPTIIAHSTVIHMSGTLDAQGASSTKNKIVLAQLLFDGGDDLITIEGPVVATSSSTSSVVSTGVGWTVDEHAGYWIKITDTDSPAYGEIRTIQGNTIDTITPMKNFSVDPWVAGLEFEIVKPSTNLTNIGGTTLLQLSGLCSYNGMIIAQRFCTSGTGSTNILTYNTARTYIAGVISDTTGGNITALGSFFQTGGTIRDPNTMNAFDQFDATTLSNIVVGLAQLNTSKNISLDYCSNVYLSSIYTNSLIVKNSTNVGALLRSGTRVKGSVLLETSIIRLNSAIENSSGYAKTVIDNASGVGFTIENSTVKMEALEINDCGSHGIEVNDSKLYHDGTAALAGTGNAGAGCYVHSQSNVHITDGSPPTLTGTVGDVSLDSTTEESTWAAIDGGTAIDGATVGNNEFVVVKEV